MRAIVVSEFGEEEVLRCQEVPVPEPGPEEVRVRLSAAGINPVETYIRAGQYAMKPNLPYTPGTDGAGVVDKAGEKIAGMKPGDRVFVGATLAKRNTGTYAEHVVCDADMVHPLAESLDFSQGAGLGTPAQTAADALFTCAGLKRGEAVLIHGATGGVGTIAVQLAVAAGATVYGTAGDQDGADLLRRLGARQVFNHHDQGHMQAVVKANGGTGLDVIIEMAADKNLGDDLASTAKKGRVVVVGSHGPMEIDPRHLMARDVTLRGLLLSNLSREEAKPNLERIQTAIGGGMTVVVGARFSLEDAPQAHRLVKKGSPPGKVVLTM